MPIYIGLNKFYKFALHLLKRTVNILLLLSMILTSCGPINQGTDTQTPATPAILPTQEAEVPQENEYIPPVFTQPEPRIADNDFSPIDPTTVSKDPTDFAIDQFLEDQEAIKNESKAEFLAVQAEMSASIEELKLQFQSFEIAPNPIRKITPKQEPVSKSVDGSDSGDKINLSPITFGKRIGSPALPDEGNTYTVTNLTDLDDGVCDFDCSLREAIFAANGSVGEDTILFSVSGTINLESTLPYIEDIEGLIIDGTGQIITVYGDGSGQIFYISSGASLTLIEILIDNGYYFNDGILILSNTSQGVHVQGEGILSLSNCSVGGLYSTSSVNLINCSITDSSIYTEGSLTVTDSSFQNSSIFSYGDVTVNNSTFSNDSGIYSTGPFIGENSHFSGDSIFGESSVSITDSDFTNEFIYSTGALTINGLTSSDSGSGGFHSEGTTSVTSSTFTSVYDARFYSVGAITVTNSSLSSGANDNTGSRIYCEDAITIIDSQISYTMGNIFSEELVTFIHSSFNSTDSSDIYSMGKLNFTNSTIDNSSWGYLYSEDEMTLTDSVFSYADGWMRSQKNAEINNSALNHVRFDTSSTLTITGNSSIATGGYSGDGTGTLEIDTDSTFSISNATLTYCAGITNNGTINSNNNTFANCGITNNAELHLNNTILANGSYCRGVVTNGINNLFEYSGTDACNLTNIVNGNIIGSYAVFNEKNSNFFTDIYVLSPGSPAIGQGDTAICAAAPVNNTSQNGVTRLLNSTCDIGAYEADPAPDVDEKAVVSSCSSDDCFDTSDSTQGKTKLPINTRTGGFQYSVEDISLPTTAGQLSITRDYASLGISLATTLSPGWTHNQDTRLIMPNDPGGEEDVILFKLHSSNQYTFYAQTDGTYQPATGILASLVTQAGPPITYVITDSSQNTFIFDEDGNLLTYSDPVGNQWEYTYTTTGLLDSISANEGTSSLSFTYDVESRLTSITDQTGRDVSYGYDANGDLSSVTDILDQTWTYTYDSAHRLTAALDPNGVILERNEYDEQGRVVRQYDGNGNLTVALTFNADGTTTVTDALGNSNIHTYDERGTLINETDPGGNASETTYLADFRPFRLTDEQGRITDLSWSADGANLTRLVDNEGNQINITYDEFNNPLSVIDPLNYLTTYEYDGTLLTSVTDALNKETTYTYTPEGYLESVTDSLGNTTSYTYNSQGQQTSMTDPAGNQWTYSYDPLGRLVDTTDPLLRVSHNEYDAAGRLIQTIQNYDPARPQNDENLWNIITTYAYDVRNNQISVTDTYGRIIRYEYDLADRMVKTIDPAGQESIYTYDAAGNLVSTTDVMGQITQYEYDESSRLIKTTDPLGNITQTIYNPDGTIASSIDPLGGTTSYTYDNLGRVSATTQPDGTITYNAYDAAGNLVAVKDALGNITQYEYDALSRLTKTTDPLGGFTENFYDDVGRLVQTKDALGNATTYVYNNAGQLINQTDPEGYVTSFEYDALGRRIAVTDALGNRTAYAYDLLDRVVSVTNPLGGITYTSYDAMGTVVSQKDSNGNETVFVYDILNRLTTQVNALGNITSYTYDELGNQLSVTDPLGRISYMEYDALGRMIKQIDPAGGVTTFTYDLAGNLLTTTDPNGHSTSMTYDVMGRMINQTDANGITTTFSYDADGNLLSQTDNAGNQTRFVYDPLNRQIQSIDPLGSISYSYYDANSNFVGKIDANGFATQYDYNKVGNLIAVIENVNPNGVVDNQTNVRTEYTYDANGNLQTIKDARGVTSATFSYDAMNRRISEFDAFGIPTFYAYDSVGNLITKTDPMNGPTTYVYDNANQLIKIDYQGNSIDVNFSYNAAGERTQMTDNLGSTTWTYNALGLPTAITDPYQKTVNYTYDAVGNKTSLTYPDGKTVQYSYDPGNRLASVTDWQSLVTNYSYNTANLINSVILPNSLTTT